MTTSPRLRVLDASPLKATIQHRNGARQREALGMYLELGSGRTLAKVHAILQEAYNDEAPKSVSTIERWSSWFGWSEAAAQHDATVSEIEQRKLAAKEAKERVRRHEARLEDFDLVRAVARTLLWIQPLDEQGKPIPGAGRTRQRGELSARDLGVAAAALARVAQGERLEFGEPTARADVKSNGQPAVMPKVVFVVPTKDELPDPGRLAITQRGNRCRLAG